MNLAEFNKIAGAFLGALLLFLLLGFFSKQALKSGGHDNETLAYALEIEDEASGGEVEEEVDLVQLAANASAKSGETIFRQCSACHKIEQEQNGVGPHLVGVVGRGIAAIDGYAYSNALSGKDGEWDLTALSGFLLNPQDWAPGTKMGYSGLKDPQDRVDVIAYLNEAGGSNVDLTAGMESEETAAAETEVDVSESDPTNGTDTAETVESVEEETTAGATTPAVPTDGQKATPEALESEVAEDAVDQGDVEQAARETEAEDSMEAGTQTTDRMGDASAGNDADTATAGSGLATGGDGEAVGTRTQSEAAEEEAMEMAEANTRAEAEPAADGLYANVTVEQGQKVFNQCRACHVADKEQNRVGPHLKGVVGREVASIDGYSYSSAMVGYGGVWSPDRLSAYLENPRGVIEGTKMAYRGLAKEEDRAAVIKWLNEQADAPIDLN